MPEETGPKHPQGHAAKQPEGAGPAKKEEAGPHATEAGNAPVVTEVSASLIATLGKKLDEFASSLTEDEQMALATTCALAGRGFLTFQGSAACVGSLRVDLGQRSLFVDRLRGGSVPKLSALLEASLCPGKASQFSIEGLEVEKTMTGAKSVAAAAKSVAAAACRNPGLYQAAKGVAATGGGYCG
jgi:hypothetical protein